MTTGMVHLEPITPESGGHYVSTFDANHRFSAVDKFIGQVIGMYPENQDL
jgi:hypothetical protein